jgi:hypothetical protein
MLEVPAAAAAGGVPILFLGMADMLSMLGFGVFILAPLPAAATLDNIAGQCLVEVLQCINSSQCNCMIRVFFTLVVGLLGSHTFRAYHPVLLLHLLPISDFLEHVGNIFMKELCKILLRGAFVLTRLGQAWHLDIEHM